MIMKRTLCIIAFALLAGGCNPEPSHHASVSSAQNQATNPWTKGAMVTAANPYAADAGIAMLKAGGNAVDAAIATHLVLGLVEPQSSGLGGGAFLLHFDYATEAMTLFDGRETAPAGANVDMYMGEDGALG